jgi:hypothetical protein
LLARGSAFDLLNKENAYQDADLLRKQQQDFATRFGGVGAPSPQSMPNAQPSFPAAQFGMNDRGLGEQPIAPVNRPGIPGDSKL